MKENFCVFVLLTFSLTALAQSNYAVLSGSVSDPDLTQSRGATVEVTSASTGATRQVVSNEQGLFDIPGLAPDAYMLEVKAAGFATFTQSLKLEVAQRLTIRLSLKVATLKESVNVLSQPAELRTTDASFRGGCGIESRA